MSEIIATPINNNFHVEQQQPMSLTHQSADNVIQLEMETKRARSSSMDILAEAATYTYGVEASAKRISPSIDTSSSSSSANNNSKNIYSDKKVDVPSVPKFQLALVESSIPDLHRPRGATFSYSPYNSKDPSIEIQYRPIVNGNATPRTLNWYATAADDEVNTVELLSGLSHTKKVSRVFVFTYIFYTFFILMLI